MGCCSQGGEMPPPTHIKGAFSDYMEKNEHNGQYSLNDTKGLKGAGNKSTSFYQSRSTNLKSHHSDPNHLSNPSSRSNSTDHSHNSTKGLLKAKKAVTRTNHAKSNPLAFKKQTFDSSLSPNDASPNHTSMQGRNKLSIQSNSTATTDDHNEREYSMSKSRSRQFRRRAEPRSPSSHRNMNDPPPIVEEESDDDNASSLSDEVEIPGLKPIVFDDDDEDDEDDDDDENLKIMHQMVAQENARLAQEIDAMKEHIYDQETIKMKRDAMQEIMKEMAAQHERMESQKAEEEKKRRAMERFEKITQKRFKEKEELKEERRLKKEERQKQRKRRIMQKNGALSTKEVQDWIELTLDIEFEYPFFAQLKSGVVLCDLLNAIKNGTCDEYEESERIDVCKKNVSIYLGGCRALGMDEDECFGVEDLVCDSAILALQRKIVMNLQHVVRIANKLQRDAMKEARKTALETYTSANEKIRMEGIEKIYNKYIQHPFKELSKNRPKKKAFTHTYMDDTLVDLQGFKAGLKRLGIDEILSGSEIRSLFFQMRHNDLPRYEGINAVDFCLFLKIDPITLEPKVAGLHKKVLDALMEHQQKEKERKAQNLGSFKIKISEPEAMKPPMIDLGAADEEVEDTTTNDVPETPTQSDFAGSPETPKERDEDSEISMTESMTMSAAEMTIPSNIPRKSFKQINSQWSDAISSKSFHNYKRLRQKFGLKYKTKRRQNNQTKDEELAKIHDQLMREKSLAEEEEEDETEEAMPPPPQTAIVNQDSSNSNHHVLPGIDETKEHDDMRKHNELEAKPAAATSPRRKYMNVEPDQMAKEHRESLRAIGEYKGNEQMLSLRKLYKKQHQMRQKLERLRKRSLLNFPAPPKPKNIEKYLTDKTRYICKELRVCFCKNTRYTGLANFGPNGELGIEIEFTSDCDEKGYIRGYRTISFQQWQRAAGAGRIWMDVAWNGHKYLPCTRFEWTDEGEEVTTKFEFDSVTHEIDVDHSFFQGKCIRYPSDLDPQRKATQLIMHQGFFDFVCVSARRRDIRHNSLLHAGFDDVDGEDEAVPKYVRRMSAYTEKIDQLYISEDPVTRDTLFGDAIATLPMAMDTVNEHENASSIPEQINE